MSRAQCLQCLLSIILTTKGVSQFSKFYAHQTIYVNRDKNNTIAASAPYTKAVLCVFESHIIPKIIRYIYNRDKRIAWINDHSVELEL